MSLMLKLLSISLLTSSLIYASSIEVKLSKFIENKLKQAGPKLKVNDVKIAKKFELKSYDGWSLYFVDVKLTVTQNGIAKPAEQRYELFSNGRMVSLDLLNIRSGESLKALASPAFDKKFYTKANLIAGHANAKHKIVVFSDPLCPFCTELVPGLIKDAKENPDTFALYLFHFPLSMHPAAGTIVKCMVAAEMKGIKDIALRTYTVDTGKKIKHKATDTVDTGKKIKHKATDKGANPSFSMQETNEKRILNEFNKALRLKLTIADITNPKVLNHVRKDREIQKLMLVNSTPTVYVNEIKDPRRNHYNKIRKVELGQ